MLTELTIWLEAGPAAILRALNMFERGQMAIRAGIDQTPDKFAPVRNQLASAAAVWILLMLVLGLGGGLPVWSRSPVLASAAWLFVALLTIRLLMLLRRLTVK
jgi:hypothetical protein